jgi:DNA polymerase-3 subunit epsilon
MWLDRIPASVAFCDVETTGLTKDDRIVSFGGIGMISNAQGRLRLDYTYLVFDPGKSNHRDAQQVHGFSDWVLAVQDRFEVHAAQVWRFLTSYELLVAHNAAFDFRFINREMTLAGLSSLAGPIYCTMKGYRALGLGGSASRRRRPDVRRGWWIVEACAPPPTPLPAMGAALAFQRARSPFPNQG